MCIYIFTVEHLQYHRICIYIYRHSKLHIYVIRVFKNKHAKNKKKKKHRSPRSFAPVSEQGVLQMVATPQLQFAGDMGRSFGVTGTEVNLVDRLLYGN